MTKSDLKAVLRQLAFGGVLALIGYCLYLVP